MRPFLSMRIGLASLLFIAILFSPMAHARSAVTPWTSEQGFQNLVYGASTTGEVLRVMGAYPDEIVKTQQMTPVIENYYYYDAEGSGAATVFVFQNNFLAGLMYKSSSNQYMDLTYFLPNNGDMNVNSAILGNMRGYFPNLPLYSLY
jgi:hypothetical protein